MLLAGGYCTSWALQKLGMQHKLAIAEAEQTMGALVREGQGIRKGAGGGGKKQPQTPPEMFLQRLLLTKLNIMPTDKGEVLGATFTGRV